MLAITKKLELAQQMPILTVDVEAFQVKLLGTSQSLERPTLKLPLGVLASSKL